ncbi:MAG: CocE/NonD family hydrolase [Acidobacteria bacterium]|nr:CocE/NonD family hydrolase [Acidobacteriota bacterium]MBI3423892.1 CocE/NonD family hydrolase [Acidobacteriota bacterium]
MKKAAALSCSLVFALLVFATPRAHTQQEQGFALTNAMIPMRDGVWLNTNIFAPKNASAPLPIILERTPYNAPANQGWANGKYKALAADGYIFVFQDIRGRYKSEGQFVMQRAPVSVLKHDPKLIDEVTDAYDTIEWLIKNVPNNNGRVGIVGISYPGWTAAMATLAPHPALRAASPQASPADMFLGDDFHHNGAFRLSYGFEYATMMETNKEQARFEFDRYDTFEWYLRLGALSNVNEKYLHGKIPTWNDFVNHPNYDQFWQEQAMAGYLKQVNVPLLNVAGWWDQEDFYGPTKIYETLEPHDTKRQNFLVAGPWNHGGWARGDGSSLGRIKFGSNTAQHYRERIEAPWFAYWLKDKGTAGLTEAITFQTGANEWKSYDQWPPRNLTVDRQLYFHAAGNLSFDAPNDAGHAFDSYVSDPRNPVPYRPRPIEATYDPRGSDWGAWLVEDQRFASQRPDVANWQTEMLTEDVTITGKLSAHLFAATTGSDSDWIVKLIDVYPDDYPKEPKMGGYQLMVANDVLRGRFRQGFEKPLPIVPNAVNEYTIDLHHLDHRFLKGHKIMVQVQSTWFPVIDRNPQKFVPNIFQAKDADYVSATQRIYRSKIAPSHLRVPVVK